MATNFIVDLLGEILVSVGTEKAWPGHNRVVGEFTNIDKLLLTATALASYVIARFVFATLGLPAVPGFSTLIIHGQPIYAVSAIAVVFVLLTLLARPLVGGIRRDAPVFCAAIGLLALPTHSGDLRNALLDAGGPGVYVAMAIEIVLLAVVIAVAFGVAHVRVGGAPQLDPMAAEPDAVPPASVDDPIDTPIDRLTAVGVQTVVTLALLSLLGQSPLKGQAMLGVAFAGGVAAWMSFKTRQVRGSLWYVAGTMLAGLIAYAWTRTQPDGYLLGDTRGYLAGAARSLPLHYATAGVAGTIYGYWVGRHGAEGMLPPG